jgi:hypothetical protein
VANKTKKRKIFQVARIAVMAGWNTV